MPAELSQLFKSFEDCRFAHEGTEAWRARELMTLLGYEKWERFRGAIARAWESCASTKVDPAANFLTEDSKPWSPGEVFPGAGKNPTGGRPSEDVILTRRAAYLVAMNGDPRKPAIAFAQHYFATATRTLEVLQKRLIEADRLTARGELTETENKFSGVLFEAGLNKDEVARVRSRGDEVLFGGNDTRTMKKKWGVPENRPLADFAPEVAIRAKQLSAAITSHNVKANDLSGEDNICDEHETNSHAVRDTVLSRGIVLEKLPPEEDIKKVERRHAADLRKLAKPDPKPKAKTASKAKSSKGSRTGSI